MSRFRTVWEDDGEWGEQRGSTIPPATEKQLDYLADLIDRAGWEPAGYDPENLNIREASDMIEEMLEG